MSHPFEIRLKNIRESLLRMATLTGRNLSLAVQAFTERDDARALQVEELDAEIDSLEMEIDNLVLTHMATHGPVASDSRLMLITSKISSDLERIADQATTIARRAQQLNQAPQLAEVPEIATMAELAQRTLHDSVTSFVEGRCDIARAIIPKDRQMDELNREVARKMIELMMAAPENVIRAIHLMTVAKVLERASDHVQNIAEQVVYLYSGEDIRHF